MPAFLDTDVRLSDLLASLRKQRDATTASPYAALVGACNERVLAARDEIIPRMSASADPPDDVEGDEDEDDLADAWPEGEDEDDPDDADVEDDFEDDDSDEDDNDEWDDDDEDSEDLDGSEDASDNE